MPKTSGKMRYYKVTLTLNFRYHYDSVEQLELDTWTLESDDLFKMRCKDFEATDEKYGTLDKIIAYVKSFNAFEFVEYLPEQEVVSAEWDPTEFKIHFIVKTDDPEDSRKSIRSWLQWSSLEDCVYEACGDNGWTIKTLGETMEYGLTDFRDNPIEITKIDASAKIPAA